jgi:predicted nucleic acid-binding protein
VILIDPSVWIDYFRGEEDGHALLYSDRDFDPFVKFLGLRSALI